MPGSVLVPLLLFMYIIDELNSGSHGVLLLLSDDIKLVYPIEPSEICIAVGRLCTHLSALDGWCTS